MSRTDAAGRGRTWLTLVLVGAFAWSLSAVPWGESLFHPGGAGLIGRILSGTVSPALSADILAVAVTASWRTLAYAAAGMTLALTIAAIFGTLASGVLAATTWGRRISIGLFRPLLAFMRAIHELVWAWLFVAAIGLSPLAGILALGIPYGGILGRILADMLNDVPEAPLQALRSSGAGEFQVLLYGRLPMALADMVSYAMYRFECAIRSAAIMSFVGLAGLGHQIQLSLEDLNYGEVWTFVYFLVLLVVIVDAWSGVLRRELVTS